VSPISFFSKMFVAASSKSFQKSLFVVPNSTTKSSLSKRSVHDLQLSGTVRDGGIIATVFGSTGFLGRFAVGRLARLGIQVVIPYRGEERYWRHLKVEGEVGQIVPFKYDIRNKDLVHKAVSHSNIVVNLVGRNWDTRNFTMEQANIESAKTIANACKVAGVQRLIHVSTVGKDSNPSKFFKTKREGEEAVRSIYPEATILRIATPFGPGDRFLNRWGYIGRHFNNFPLLVNKDATLQPFSAQDFGLAVQAVLADRNSVGSVYELGGPSVLTYDEFVKQILFTTTKNFTGSVINISPFWADKIAWLLEKGRQALVTRDELKYMNHDLVVNTANKDIKTFQDLNIHPLSVHDMAITVLRGYRRPANYNV